MNPLTDVVTARRRFLAIAAAAAAATVLGGCSADPTPQKATGTAPSGPPIGSGATMPPSPDPSTGSAAPSSGSSGPAVAQPLRSSATRRAAGSPAEAQRSLAGFGAEILRRVHGQEPNTALSPYSLATVLAMARAGAKGATGTQVDKVLRLDGIEAQGGAITAIDDANTAAVKSATKQKSPMMVEPANQTWIQSGLDVHQEYLDELARQFGVAAVAADFAADPEAMRTQINAWVSERTHSLIPELFGAGTIEAATVLVLVNAVYLKAAWQTPFIPGSDPTPFTTGAGSTTPVSLMRAGETVPGAKGSGWISATAGYVGRGLAMTILVPDAGTFDTVLAALDAETIAAATATTGHYTFQMPAFQIHSAPPVKEAVVAMGITDLFDSGKADLSGMAGAPGDLVASSFVHQAVVLVDENGTEAAAATGMGVSATGMPQSDGAIVVDRPFLFWIHDTVTGAPMFLGAVTDPTV